MRTFYAATTLAVSALALSTAPSFADYQLSILHINDLHSRIEQINKYDSTCTAKENDAGECFGGIARVAAKIAERKTALEGEGRNVLVLDAGDQFQGSLFYTTYKGKDAAEFMNAIKPDAMAIGNHEFDDGPKGLSDFYAEIEFPLISGNTKVADGEGDLAGKIKEWVIADKGGEKVGILSVLTPDTQFTASPGPNVTFEDEIEYLKGAVERIQAEGVNKIVLVSHVGFPRDQEIAAAVDGIDVIVGGHSHTLLSNTEEGAPSYPTNVKNPSGKDVPIVQAYAYSKYVGELNITFDDEGNITQASGDTILLDNSVQPDEAIAARVSELAEPIEELKSRVVAESTGPIDGSRETCRAQECEMGNLVADAMLDRVKDQGISIAVQNGGGLRASIDAGEVTMGEVLTVLPFQNTVATFQLRGKDIVSSLEAGVSEIEEGKGRFPQVSGLQYTFDMNNAANEGRVTNVKVNEGGSWVDIDPEKQYGVVTNNFNRNGGDGYSLFRDNAENAYDYGPNLEEAVAAYLADNTPYTPKIDGRITKIAATAQDTAPEVTTQPATPAPTAEQPATPAPAAEQTAPAPAATQEQTASAQAGDTEAQDAPSAGQSYAIKQGDTLWDIAEAAYGNGAQWRMIRSANTGISPRRLVVGATLDIPATN